MAKKVAEPTSAPRERAFLVGVEFYGEKNMVTLEESLNELALLADTAGVDVVGRDTQNLDKPNPGTYIGSGKVEEVKALVENTLADVVIFDCELSPRHQRELGLKFGNAVRVIDRTALILDIFAQHAHTREGILQVELAQFEYLLPRLTRAWTHLGRQAGGATGRTGGVGGVGLRGPGETQLEVDRREIKRKISSVKKELENVRAHRMRYRAQRKSSEIPVVVLVGYTNAGKSSLMNRLAKSNVFVANKLFATLDPTTRQIDLPGNHRVLLTDTVGFIQKLPTQLIAAFRATLEEIAEADLLIHVVDITHSEALSQARAVHDTLKEIGADQVPVVTALNKIDLIKDHARGGQILEGFGSSCVISAKTGEGLEDLLIKVERQLYDTYIPVRVRLPYQQGQLLSLFYDQGQIEKVEHEQDGVSIIGNLPIRLLARYRPFIDLAIKVDDRE